MVTLLRKLGDLLVRVGHPRLPKEERNREIAIIHLNHAIGSLALPGDVHEALHVTMMVRGLMKKNKKLKEERASAEDISNGDEGSR